MRKFAESRKNMLSLFKKMFSKNENKSMHTCKYTGNTENTSMSKNLYKNVDCLKRYMSNSMDIRDRRFKAGGNKTNVAILFIDNLVDETMVQDHIIKPIMINSPQLCSKEGVDINLETIKDYMLYGDIIEEASTIHEISLGILEGKTFLCVEGSDKGFLINTMNLPKRTVEEPTTEPSVKGPKEGFLESLKDNTALIRKRLKNPNLCVETIKTGKHTNNSTVMFYLKGTAKNEIVEEVRRRINSVDSYDIVDVEQLAHLISDRAFSIFPMLQWTERPDKAVIGLLEGKVGIMMDNSRGILLAPATLSNLMQSVDDYYEMWIVGTAVTLIRYAALLISTFLPATYIAVTSFHPGMLPTDLTLSIAGSRAGVPFPAFLEALLMVVTLELLQEAGIRLPRVVGQTVSIVGGLVIGQSAVQAGIISPIMVIILSVTAISSFAIPNYSLSLVTRVLRVVFMVLAGLFGAFGISMGVLYLLGYMCSLRSFGIGYMEPLTPYRFRDWKDSIIRAPQFMLKNRPEYLLSRKEIDKTGKGGSKGGK